MPQGEKEEQKDSKVQGRNSCRCWHSPSSPKPHSFAETTVASSSHAGTSSPSPHAPHQPSLGKSRVFATGKEGTMVPPSKSPHVPRATPPQYGTRAHVPSRPWSISTLQSQRVRLPFSCREPHALP